MKFRMRVVDTQHDCLVTVGWRRQPQQERVPYRLLVQHFHLLGGRSRLRERRGKTSLYRRQRYAQHAAGKLCSRGSRIKKDACPEDPEARTNSIAPERVISTSTLPLASGT